MASYHLSQAAKKDLFRIYQYGLQRYGVKQADKYYLDFFERFEQIAYQPSLFPQVPHIREGYRRCPCGEDSIYYRVDDGIVVVIRIIGKQDFGKRSPSE